MVRFILLWWMVCCFASPLLADDESAAAQENTTQTADAPADEPTVTRSPLESLRLALDSDVEARYEALGRISPRGVSPEDRARMVELLIPQMDSDYPEIRGRTAEALTLFGSDAKPAIPILLKHIGDKEPQINLEAVWIPVSKALAAIGHDALQPLVDAIPESDRVTYYGITAAISEMGEAAGETAPTFIEILRTGPENRRWATMFTLSKLGDAAQPAIPDFIQNLDHENFNLQCIACRALAKHGAKSADAVPRLLKLTEKGILSSKTHAAMCLAAIGPREGVDLIALLKKMIQENNAFSQERGMIALGRLGEHAKDTGPFIEEMIAKPDFSQKPEAARTLWQVTGNSERALEILKSLIDDPTYQSRVFQALADMGPAASAMADELGNRLETDDQSARLILLDILANMGPVAKSQLPKIQACLEDGSREVLLSVDALVQQLGDE